MDHRCAPLMNEKKVRMSRLSCPSMVERPGLGGRSTVGYWKDYRRSVRGLPWTPKLVGRLATTDRHDFDGEAMSRPISASLIDRALTRRIRSAAPPASRTRQVPAQGERAQ